MRRSRQRAPPRKSWSSSSSTSSSQKTVVEGPRVAHARRRTRINACVRPHGRRGLHLRAERSSDEAWRRRWRRRRRNRQQVGLGQRVRDARRHRRDRAQRRNEHRADGASTERDVVLAATPLERLAREEHLAFVIGVALRADAFVALDRAVADVRPFDAHELRPDRKRPCARERKDERNHEHAEKSRDGRPKAPREARHPTSSPQPLRASAQSARSLHSVNPSMSAAFQAGRIVLRLATNVLRSAPVEP